MPAQALEQPSLQNNASVGANFPTNKWRGRIISQPANAPPPHDLFASVSVHRQVSIVLESLRTFLINVSGLALMTAVCFLGSIVIRLSPPISSVTLQGGIKRPKLGIEHNAQ